MMTPSRPVVSRGRGLCCLAAGITTFVVAMATAWAAGRSYINAGADDTILLPETAFLNGTLVLNGQVQTRDDLITWSKLEGPGSVTFKPSANVQDPEAVFTVKGDYTLQACFTFFGETTCDEVKIYVRKGGKKTYDPDEDWIPAGGIVDEGGKYLWIEKPCDESPDMRNLSAAQAVATTKIEASNSWWLCNSGRNNISFTRINFSERYLGTSNYRDNPYRYLGIPPDQSDYIPSAYLSDYATPDELKKEPGVMPSCLEDYTPDGQVYGFAQGWWGLPDGGTRNPDGSVPGFKISSTGKCIPDWRDWSGTTPPPQYTGGPYPNSYLGCGDWGVKTTADEVECSRREYVCAPDKSGVALNEPVTFTITDDDITPLLWDAVEVDATPKTQAGGRSFTVSFSTYTGARAAQLDYRIAGGAVLRNYCRQVLVDSPDGEPEPEPDPTSVTPRFKQNDCVEVKSPQQAPVHSGYPTSQSNFLGYQLSGSAGRVIEAPKINITYRDVTYHIDFLTGDDGWVRDPQNGAMSGTAKLDSSTKCSTPEPQCTDLTFQTATSGFSPASVVPGGQVSVRCDFGQGANSIVPLINSVPCYGWTSFTGTVANFTCTAPSTAGSYTVACELRNDTPESAALCAEQDTLGTLTVTGGGGGGDTTRPTITITSPTTAATYTATATPVSLAGTASDNVGVTQVSWANSRGGSGTATGTTSWTASVALVSGENRITVTARDAAGNIQSDILTVTYTAGGGGEPEPGDCDDPISPPPPGCGEPDTGTDHSVPITYPFDPTYVRGGGVLPSTRIEVSNPAGAKVYTKSEFGKMQAHRIWVNQPDGSPFKTQPQGTKGTILPAYADYNRMNVDFDPPGYDAANDGFVDLTDIETLFGATVEPYLKDKTSSEYNAEVTIVNPPTTLQPDEKRVISVRVKNTGTATWLAGGSASRNYELVVGPAVSNEVDWGVDNFRDKTGYLTHDLAPGAETTIPFTVIAPVTGKYVLRVRLRGGESGAPSTMGWIGASSNDVVITVGNPSAASLACPSGYEVVDLNTRLRFRGYYAHHWAMYRLARGEKKKYCMVVDETPDEGELLFSVYDGTDDSQTGYWNLKVVPPAGSGLQIRRSDKVNDDAYWGRGDYRTRGRVILAQPVPGNYLLEVSSNFDTPPTAYIAAFMNRGDAVTGIQLRGTIKGKTIDKNGNGTAAQVFLSKATFRTRPSGYEYEFPNLLDNIQEVGAVTSASELTRIVSMRKFKVSAYKKDHTAEYRIDNGPWRQGSWTYIEGSRIRGGTVTVDWRFTSTTGDEGGAEQPPTPPPAPEVGAGRGNIEIRGSVSDPTATVSVNGRSATVLAGGRFTATVAAVEGSNTVTVTARNRVGETVSRSVHVALDTTPPHRTAATVNGRSSGAHLAAGTSQATLRVTTAESSTCRWGSLAGTTYSAIPASHTLAASAAGQQHEVALTGLRSGSSFTGYVRCQDAVGNANAVDYPITFTVDGGP